MTASAEGRAAALKLLYAEILAAPLSQNGPTFEDGVRGEGVTLLLTISRAEEQSAESSVDGKHGYLRTSRQFSTILNRVGALADGAAGPEGSTPAALGYSNTGEGGARFLRDRVLFELDEIRRGLRWPDPK